MNASLGTKKLFAGVDAPAFDAREFHVSKNDIAEICDFFSIGKLRSFKCEKNTVVSHSNFFVFTKTSQGPFAIKFFPGNAAKSISIEYAVNRFLISRDFPTPMMHCGRNHKAYLACNGRLATCFTFIDGKPAWQLINKPGTPEKINSSISSLKRTLAGAPTRIPRIEQDNFTVIARTLAQTSKENGYYDQKEFIDGSLKAACRDYQEHRRLFIRQWLHNNTTLTNFLIKGKIVYPIDLSHIRKDYFLSDLASLIISCHFLGIPQRIIDHITKNYFRQSGLGPQHQPVLRSLMNISLIKEYLKTIGREKNLPSVSSSERLKKAYLFYLRDRKKTILRVLKKRA